MPSHEPPQSVRDRAARRAEARAVRDWDLADRLKAEIEGAGWRVKDSGLDWRLEPAAPADVVDAETPRYGSWRSVPSRLASPPDAPFSVHLLAEDWPSDLSRCLAGLRAHARTGTQVVVTANAPSPEQEARLAPGGDDLRAIRGREVEVVGTAVRLGHAAARNVGLQRSAGEIVVLADSSIEVTGDALGPLADALADPGVAVAGAFGVTTADLRQFRAADGPRVDAIEGPWLAFRRPDLEALGPLDEQFAFERSLDIWWSLVLRAGTAGAPRSAIRVPLPLVRHEGGPSPTLSDRERDRLTKRNFYRVLERFRSRPDLLSGEPATATR